MKLERLSLYSTYDGTVRGTIEFSGDSGKVELLLKQEHIQSILRLIAEAAVLATKEIADNLTCEIIEQAAPAIENKEESK